MKKVILLLGLLLGWAGGPAFSQDLGQLSRKMLEWVKAGQGDSVYVHLDSKMQTLVSPSDFSSTWKQLETQLGALQSEGEWQQTTIQGMTAHFVDLKFGMASLRFLLVFDPDGRANTLRLMPVPPENVPVAAVFDSVRLEERPIEVVTGAFRLPGTATLPKGGKRLPVVVLVQGSGPQDRNGTLGPNKMYRDLAWGLAAEGLAVIRYDKRTYVYKEKSSPEGQDITPDMEVTEDALSAVRLARTLPFADSSRVFVAGHSLGGLMIPRIASRCAGLAGVVLLAAPSRPMRQVLESQVRYLSVGGEDETAIAARLKELLQVFPAGYLKQLDSYQPVMTAYGLTLPMLFMQGERDYQVTMEDFSMWRVGLMGRKNAVFCSYPSLNHLFMRGEGRPMPDEYMKPSQVSPAVVKDMAEWMKGI